MRYDFDTVIKRYNCGSEKWEDLKKFGVTPEMDVMPMGNAEMEFPNAPEIIKGLKEYLSKTVLAYYEYDLDHEYLETVSWWMKHRHDWDVSVESIVPCPGLHCGTPLAAQAFSKPGEGIIVMEPTWPGFFGSIRMPGMYRITSPLFEENGRWYIDFDNLEEKASDPRNTMLMFCSPQNPVSRVWSKEELEKVAEICLKHNVTILSDELHSDLTMPGFKHYSFASIDPEVAQHSIICTAPSKSFNLAGLSTSNVIIPNSSMRETYKNAMKANYIQGPNMLGIKACQFAYRRAEKWLDACVAKIESNAKFVNDYLKNNLPMISAAPFEATYLMWLDFRKLNVPHKKLEQDLTKAKVFFDAGYYFGKVGCEGYERVNIACPTQALKEALDRVAEYVNSLDL